MVSRLKNPLALDFYRHHHIWLVGTGGAGCNIIKHVTQTNALCVAANHEWRDSAVATPF